MSSELIENKNLVSNDEIKRLIYTVRGRQVMLDSDVAMLYEYTTKNINKAVKRNIERFPDDFCFQLTEDEFKYLRFQIGTSNKNVKVDRGGRRYLPYVFTEQGIAMLAGVLKNEIAVSVSINIIKSFIEMRKLLSSNIDIFERVTNIENKIMKYDEKFDEVFNRLQYKEEFEQKVFFKGQIFDAYELIVDIIKEAKNSIIIIDNYIDDNVLKMLIKKNSSVKVTIISSDKVKISNLDIQKFNEEYPFLSLKISNNSHDRFIIIDEKNLYHCGASIKDLGKKCFGINKIDDKEILEKVIELCKI